MPRFRQRPDIKFRRKRSTSAAGISSMMNATLDRNRTGAIGEPIYADTKVPQMLPALDNDKKRADKTFVQLAGVHSKLNQVLQLAKDLDKAEYIPVDISAANVRQAVMRRDRRNAPDGARIYWELFERIMERAVNRHDFVNFEFLDNLQNEPYADTQAWNAGRIANDLRGELDDIIGAARVTSGPGGEGDLPQTNFQSLRQQSVDDEWGWLRSILLYAAPLIYLYFDYKLKGPFKSMDDAAIVAGKQPSGTEIVAIILQIVVGILIYMLIHAVSKSDMKKIMREMGMHDQMDARGITTNLDDLIDSADSILQGETVLLGGQEFNINNIPFGVSLEFLRNAVIYFGQGDWEVLLEYCTSFLMNHLADDSYTPWHMYMDAKIGEREVGRAMESAPLYSPLFRAHAQANNATFDRGGMIQVSDNSQPLPALSQKDTAKERRRREASELYVDTFGDTSDPSSDLQTPARDDKAQTWSQLGNDLLTTAGDSVQFTTGEAIDDFEFWKMMTLDEGEFGYRDWMGNQQRFVVGQGGVDTQEDADRLNINAGQELRQRFESDRGNGPGISNWAWGASARGRQGVEDAKQWLSDKADVAKLDAKKESWLNEIAFIWNNVVESLVANLVWKDWYDEFLCCFVRAAVYFNPTMLSWLKELLKWASVSMTVDIGGMLKKLYDKYWVGTMEEFKKELHALLDSKWKGFIETSIRPFVERSLDEEFNEFCLLWKMMLEGLLGAMAQFKGKMDAILDDLFARLVLTSNLFNLKFKAVLGIKQLDMFVKLLDIVVDFVEQCGVVETDQGLTDLENWLKGHGLERFADGSPTLGDSTSPAQPGVTPSPIDGIAGRLVNVFNLPSSVLSDDQQDVPINTVPVAERPHNVITAYGHEVDLPVQYSGATPTNSWWFGEPLEYDYSLVVMPVKAMLERRHKDEEFAEEQQRRCRDQMTPARMMAMARDFPRSIVNPRVYAQTAEEG